MFLNPNEIEPCFENDFTNDGPKDARIKKNIYYLDKTYVHKNQCDISTQYLGQKRSHVGENHKPLSFFSYKSGNLFTSANPNIAVFIKNVIAMQIDSYIRMNLADINESKVIITKKK